MRSDAPEVLTFQATKVVERVAAQAHLFTMLNQLGDLFETSLKALGATYWFVIRDNGKRLAPAPWVRMPTEFIERYQKDDWTERDAFVHGAVGARTPFVWQSSTSSDNTGASELAALPSFSWADQVNGFTLPVVGSEFRIDLINVALPECLALDPAFVVLAATVCQLIWWQVLQRENELAKPRVTLSERELLVLNWIKEGKSQRDIGTILGLTPRAVEFHSSNILRKLDAGDKVTAIVTAIRLQLITL